MSDYQLGCAVLAFIGAWFSTGMLGYIIMMIRPRGRAFFRMIATEKKWHIVIAYLRLTIAAILTGLMFFYRAVSDHPEKDD